MLGLIIEKKNILDNIGISYDIFSLRDHLVGETKKHKNILNVHLDLRICVLNVQS